jgi:iron complex outermembrane receptor protein
VFIFSLFLNPQYSFSYTIDAFVKEISETYKVNGKIIDSETLEPLPFVALHIDKMNRYTITDINGEFIFNNLPKGQHEIEISRLGYEEISIAVNLNDEFHVNLSIKLSLKTIFTDSLVISADNYNSSSHISGKSYKLYGNEIRRNFGITLSETISRIPGVEMRSNGVSTTRPVIRGLDGYRVQLRLDGNIMQDVSATYSDHAVTLNSDNAIEIDIVKGPDALQYGSNMVGGIVNVVKNIIPNSMPSKLNGVISMSGDLAAPGGGLGIQTNIPVEAQSLSIGLDVNGRYHLDQITPVGTIKNTYNQNTDNTIGLTKFTKWGYIGGSFNSYISNYGVAPNDKGHTEGVHIELEKYGINIRSEIYPKVDKITRFKIDYNYANYFHLELESQSPRLIGMEFGQTNHSLNFTGNHSALGFFDEGLFGIEYTHTDYLVKGAGTPHSESYDLGAFLVQEIGFNKFDFKIGSRFDYANRNPKVQKISDLIGKLESKSYYALSGSISSTIVLSEQQTVSFTTARTFRPPSLDELFSEGPHLASYSFDIGNTNLKAERAWTSEINYEFINSRVMVSTSLFRNYFDSYNFFMNTNQSSNRYPDLYYYQVKGVTAEMMGLDAEFYFSITNKHSIKSSLSFIEASFREDNSADFKPIPFTPPLKISSEYNYNFTNGNTGVIHTFSDKQDRVGEFETITESYNKLDFYLQYNFINKNNLLKASTFSTLSLNIQNIFNTEYYNHLSRIKDLVPEMGRRFMISYKIYY